MKSFNSIATAVMAAGCMAFAAQASAQTRTKYTPPLIIHPPALGSVAIGEELTTARGTPILTMRTTTMRAAQLGTDTAAPAGFGLAKMFPAGTKMFGIHTPGGWAYCAVAEATARWWTTDKFVCYEDADKDGMFESAMRSGAPFMGLPLLVFETGERIPLETPAPYSQIDVKDGPSMDTAIHIIQTRSNVSHGVIALQATMNNTTVEGMRAEARLNPNGPTSLSFMDLEVEILSNDEDGTVRYRVLKAPEQGTIHRGGMRITTTYTPIFIPG